MLLLLLQSSFAATIAISDFASENADILRLVAAIADVLLGVWPVEHVVVIKLISDFFTNVSLVCYVGLCGDSACMVSLGGLLVWALLGRFCLCGLIGWSLWTA